MKYRAIPAALLSAGLLMAPGAFPAGEKVFFSQREMATSGDFALVFLRSGGTPEELSKLCQAGLCTVQQPLPAVKKPAPKPAGTTKTKSESSKLELLRKLHRKVSSALSKLQTEERQKGRVVAVRRLSSGYLMRYQGGQKEVVPPHTSRVTWFSIARDASRQLVAIKAQDDNRRRWRLVLKKNRFVPVGNLQGLVDRGSFSTAWLKAGGAPHLIQTLQEAVPMVNLSRIQRGFRFQVLLGPFDEGGRMGMQAVSFVVPELDEKGTGFLYSTQRSVKVGGRFTRPGDQTGFVAANWPMENASLEVLGDRLVFTNPRAMKPSRRVTALDKGQVSAVIRPWWLVAVDYENGYSLLYDGVLTDLKPGDTVTAGMALGTAPYGNLVVRGRDGWAEQTLRHNPLAFRRSFDLKPGQAIRAIFESSTQTPDAAQANTARLWSFLLNFFDEEKFAKDVPAAK